MSHFSGFFRLSVDKRAGKTTLVVMILTIEKFAEKLGIARKTILRWKKDGMPLTPTGKVNYEAALRWRLSTMSKDPRGSNLQQRFAQLLDAFTGKRPEIPCETPQEERKILPIPQISRKNVKLGPQEALLRVYEVEATAYERVRLGLEADASDTIQKMKAWSDMLDTLRRMETDFQKLEVAQGKLVSVDSVRESHGILIATLKSGLFALPSKISPMLAGRPWEEIHDILRKEISDAFRGCSEVLGNMASGQLGLPPADPAPPVDVGRGEDPADPEDGDSESGPVQE